MTVNHAFPDVNVRYEFLYTYISVSNATLLSCPTSISLYVWTVHGHHQVLSVLPKLFHFMSKLRITSDGPIRPKRSDRQVGQDH
jgi:hypothetical protein